MLPDGDDRRMGGLGEVLALSWPASLTMLNNTLMQFVDGLMVARVGPSSLAAQFVGGIFAFAPTSLALGMLTVVNTYVSQNLGSGRPQRCGQYAWAGIAIALVYSLTLGPLLILLSGRIFSFMPHTETVQALETTYFRYMISAMGLFLAARVLGQFFFGIHRPGIVLAASLISNLVNVGLNYVLIYGKLGMPAMGLEGAALGTLCSAGVLLGLLLAVFLAPSMHARYGTRALRQVRRSQCGELMRIGWPAGVQFSNDSLSWGVFISALVGQFGTAHMAASTVAMRYMSLSFMPAVGVSIATTAIVGRYIGMGRHDIAQRRAHAALVAAMAYMGLCGACFLVFRYPLARFFAAGVNSAAANIPIEQVVEISTKILICAAVFQLFDAMAIVFIGALRGAGDTFVPMVLTIVLCWTLVLGGGLVMVKHLPALESLGPWLTASLYVIVLGVLVAWRFESGRWKKIRLLDSVVPPAGAP
ncbi:MAG TPA: hypothetical protein DCX07_02790 [Phycisphaerales bacterium]|nr:hypothetical protein [Phycisphaerales bacterium]